MAVRAFVVALAVLATSAAGAEETWVPISVDSAGTVIVPVVINGAGPFRFLLDTGSAHSVISDTLAERLSLAAVAKTLAVTSTGEGWRPVVRFEWTAIGATRTDGLLASVTPSARLKELAPRVEGIIGQDFLYGLNYTLDYAGKRLLWSVEIPEGAVITRLPLLEYEGRYLIELPAGPNRGAIHLVPDSGADRLVLFERHGLTAIAAEPVSFAMAVQTLSGGRAVRGALVRELRLGALALRNQEAAIVPRATGDAAAGDGLLPLHLFASVTFDARERCLVLRAYAE